MQYMSDLCSRKEMKVNNEPVATKIIKYLEVLGEWAVSVVSYSFLPGLKASFVNICMFFIHLCIPEAIGDENKCTAPALKPG